MVGPSDNDAAARRLWVEAFILHLGEDPNIQEHHLEGFEGQVAGLFDRLGAEQDPRRIRNEQVEELVEARRSLQEPRQSLNNLRTAGKAWVAFSQRGDFEQWVQRAQEAREVAQSQAEQSRREAEREAKAAAKQKAPRETQTLAEQRVNDGRLEDPQRWVRHTWNLDGLTSSIAVCTPILLSWLPVLGPGLRLARWGALMAVCYAIVNHLSRNRPGLPAGNELGHSYGMGYGQIWRAFVTTLALIGPAAFVSFSARWTNEWDTLSIVAALLALLLGAFLGPAAIIAGEVSGSTFAAVYPLAWFKIMWRMPKDYWQVALYTVPIFILVVVWETASRMLTPHWLVDIVLALPANFLWFSIACLCGRVIYLHEEDFGFRSSDRPTYGERKPL